MIIIKFGGTSVQNEEAIGRVISIVKGRLKEKPLVVVSGLGSQASGLGPSCVLQPRGARWWA